MILNDPSTISRWMSEPGDINLRHAERKPFPDLNAARGIFNALVIVAVASAWIWVIVWALLR
jgi:hypothetical protein